MNTLLEEFCKKLINEQLIEWFGIRHAKALCALKKYEKLLASELSLLTGTEKQALSQILSELKKAKLVEFNGEKFQLCEELEALNRLIEFAERQELKITARER